MVRGRSGETEQAGIGEEVAMLDVMEDPVEAAGGLLTNTEVLL